jgi:hypothetical protein
MCTGIEAVFLLELQQTENRILELMEENTLTACARGSREHLERNRVKRQEYTEYCIVCSFIICILRKILSG